MKINRLVDKYLDEKKKLPGEAPKGYEWVKDQWVPKKKKVDESSGCGTGSDIMGAMWWNKRMNLIYIRNEEVLFSSTAEFPTGSPMTDEIRQSAKARGYILLDW